ncbi:MAG: hypothetical protein P1V97_06990 [Planctomycetota bacterium]|nr:hypothetical protein [Planctomycetota bacterium]
MPSSRPLILASLFLATLSLIGTGCSSTRAGDEYFTQGTKSWELGKDDDAIKAYSLGLRKDAEHEQMRLNLARIYYERGETPYLQNRRLLKQVDAAEDRKDMKASSQLKIQADTQHKQAEIHYRACNEQLDELLAKAEKPKVVAHAAYLRFRTALFFEDWKVAKSSLRQAIDKGGLEGTRKAKYESFLRRLETETPGALIKTDDS